MASLPLLIILPLIGAIIALAGKLLPAGRLIPVLSVLPIIGAAPILLSALPHTLQGEVLRYAMGGWAAPLGIELVLDGLAWASSALCWIILVPVILASLEIRSYGAPYYFFLMMLTAGMQIVILTADIFSLFVAFEVVAIAAYVLIAYDRTDAGLLAGLKYLILSTVGILFFLFGVFVIYRDVGSLSFSVLSAAMAEPGGPVDSTAIHVAVAALCVGIGVRTAFIPFHTWLPEAHAYAPHPVSALLSGILIKVSFFALMRIIAVMRAIYLSDLLMWIGGVTAVIAVIWALSQSDTKRLLAYHSISQMGYVLAAFGAAAAGSVTAGFAHGMHHALFKSLLFLVAGAAISMTGERNLFRMKPIGRRAPLLSVAFLLGAASIAGLPPFNGFMSKQLISSALSASGAIGAGAVGVLLSVAAVGTTASFIKVSRIVMPGPSRRSSPVRASAPAQGEPRRHSGILIHLAALMLAAACVATGIFAAPIARFLDRLLEMDPALEPMVPKLGDAAKLGEAGIILAAGIGLYFLAVSPPGKRVSSVLKTAAPDLRTVLFLFVVGLGVFVAAGVLP